MELPDELASRDTHIVEIFLAGLSPYDDEYEWNNRAIHDAHTWFPDRTKPHSFILAKVKCLARSTIKIPIDNLWLSSIRWIFSSVQVRLHLGDTLWVDPLEIRTKIIGYPDLVSASLKSHMIRLEHGVANKYHLSRLYELCKIDKIKNADGKDIIPVDFDTGRVENESDSMSG